MSGYGRKMNPASQSSFEKINITLSERGTDEVDLNSVVDQLNDLFGVKLVSENENAIRIKIHPIDRLPIESYLSKLDIDTS